MVDKYDKSEVRELEPEFLPFGPEFSNVPIMKVKPGSKLHSVVSYAERQLQIDACRSLIFAGVGPACTKTISIVEVLKRRLKLDLHQITRTRFKRVEEFWEPTVDGLERLKVNRDIPAMYVLLSKDVLHTEDPGYQGPGGDIPMLRSERIDRRRPHQAQHRGQHQPGDVGEEGNRWKRRPRGGGREKKQAAKRNTDESAAGGATFNQPNGQ